MDQKSSKASQDAPQDEDDVIDLNVSFDDLGKGFELEPSRDKTTIVDEPSLKEDTAENGGEKSDLKVPEDFKPETDVPNQFRRLKQNPVTKTPRSGNWSLLGAESGMIRCSDLIDVVPSFKALFQDLQNFGLTDAEKPDAQTSQEKQDPEQALEKPKIELAAEEFDSRLDQVETALEITLENIDLKPESPRKRNTKCDSSNCCPVSAAVVVQLEKADTGNGNGVKEEEVPVQVMEKSLTEKSDKSSKKKSDESSETVSEKSSKKTSETASYESSKDVRTSVIDVRNLTRPFTEKKLFDLLERTGKIVDSGFWIDKIKSHAIVKV